MRVRVDLSATATTEAKFQQTCAIAHAQIVELKPVEPAELDRLRSAVETAKIDIEVRKAGDSRNVASIEPPLMQTEDPEAVPWCRIYPVPDGEYVFIVRTEATRDAPPLPAYLCVRNFLCGCEALPGAMAVLLAAAMGFFGVVLGAVSLVVRP